jgi:hypothetical protein
LIKGPIAIAGVTGKPHRGATATRCARDIKGNVLPRGNAKHHGTRPLGEQENKDNSKEICCLTVPHW